MLLSCARLYDEALLEGGGEDYLGCGTVRRSGDGAAVCGSWALASLRCVLGMVVLYYRSTVFTLC